MTPKFLPTTKGHRCLFPTSMQNLLQEKHLAQVVVDIVSQLKFRSLAETYTGKEFKAYHPGIIISLLPYAYTAGVFLSYKNKQVIYDFFAFRSLSTNTHLEHTISIYRKRFLEQLKSLFAYMLMLVLKKQY